MKLARLGLPISVVLCLLWLSFQPGVTASSDRESPLACAPISITIGETANGSLTPDDCVDTNTAFYDGYRFTATAGDRLDFSLASEVFTSSLRLVQGVYPGGTVLATGTDPGDGSRRIGAFDIPASGQYTIVVSTATAGPTGGYTVAVETTIPRVTLIQRTSPNPAVSGSTVGFSVFFSTAVEEVGAADFTVTANGVSGAAVGTVSGTGSVYSVAVNTGSGTGTIRLDLIDNDTIVNGVGVPLGGVGVGNGNFTSGPSYTISAPTPTPSPTPPPVSIVVTTTADNGPGSLRQAVADVVPGGTITFSNLFDTPQTIFLTTGELRILKDLTILGPGPELVSISGNFDSRVFNIGLSTPGNVVTISGVTIRDGRAPDGDFGGGLEQNFGRLTLSNCVFTNNSAPEGSIGFGGGLDFFEGILTIDRCRFEGNSAIGFGGGLVVGSSTFTMTDSTIVDNTATRAAGILVAGGTATIERTTINGNDADLQGGGVYAQVCDLTIRNSTISGNTAGGPSNAGAAFVFENSSGVRTGLISNSTVANNLAEPNAGGGILVIGRSNASVQSKLDIRSTIVAGNTEPALRTSASSGATAAITSLGFNLCDSNCGGLLGVATDKLNATAGLTALGEFGGATRTHALLSSSAAIDAGNSFGLTADQRGAGFDRTVDLAVANVAGGDGTDIGAYELQNEPLPPASVTGRVTTPTGLGLRNATVILTDLQGARRLATTSSFGIYTFANIPSGVDYVISVSSKRYRFAARTLTITSDLADIDFTGLE